MAHRIEAALKSNVRDARGERIKREIEHFLHLPVTGVTTIDVYTVDAELSRQELELAASGPFATRSSRSGASTGHLGQGLISPSKWDSGPA